ncbi:MAG: hypothetical protein AAGL49_01510 [Pseudomonadota bacterium]
MTRGDVKSAYYTALKAHHPDLRLGGTADGALVAKLHDAYETLIAYADRQGAAQAADSFNLAAADAAPRRALRLHIGEEGRRLAALMERPEAA